MQTDLTLPSLVTPENSQSQADGKPQHGDTTSGFTGHVIPRNRLVPRMVKRQSLALDLEDLFLSPSRTIPTQRRSIQIGELRVHNADSDRTHFPETRVLVRDARIQKRCSMFGRRVSVVNEVASERSHGDKDHRELKSSQRIRKLRQTLDLMGEGGKPTQRRRVLNSPRQNTLQVGRPQRNLKIN